MRNIFVNTLINIAGNNEKLVLLMAEVGYGVVEPFQNKYPDRFFNTGISEQNLVLVAAGMAIRGYHPVAYSMSSFLPARAFEMIKDSISYQNLPVTLVGIGSGLSYGKLGTTHHAAEESALMKMLPNMEVLFPSDGDDCREALIYAVSSNKPVYIGLGKVCAQERVLSKPFSTKWEKIRTGNSATIFACGSMVEVALDVAEKMENRGVDTCVYKACCVKPIDFDAITEGCGTGKVIIMDEHYSIGGVGADIAEYILCSGLHKKIDLFENFSISDQYPDKVFDEKHLMELYGLNSSQIVEKLIKKF